MKVSYTPEEKKTAIVTHKRVKSYSKTIAILGYPSYHTLIDWVKGISRGNPDRLVSKPHHYSWTVKRTAIDMMLSGTDKDAIATRLGIHCPQQIYKWVRIWRAEGDSGLMSKNERGETRKRPTKKQLLESLPKDTDELRELTVTLMAEKSILEKELELLKGTRASSQENCR